jgi:hypothetical protein
MTGLNNRLNMGRNDSVGVKAEYISALDMAI